MIQRGYNAVAEKNKAKQAPKKVVSPPAPVSYTHIDTFMQTAAPMYNLSSVQVAGFKAKMQGKHYQRDQKVFIDALKEHFNIED